MDGWMDGWMTYIFQKKDESVSAEFGKLNQPNSNSGTDGDILYTVVMDGMDGTNGIALEATCYVVTSRQERKYFFFQMFPSKSIHLATAIRCPDFPSCTRQTTSCPFSHDASAKRGGRY